MKMLPALALLVAVFGQETGDDLVQFAKDTQWTYSRVELGKKKEIVRKVSRNEAGKVYLEESATEAGIAGPPVKHTYVMFLEDGYLKQAAVRDGQQDTAICFYKLSSKKGDRWRMAPADEKNKTEVVHMGIVEVETPAGTYKNAIQLQVMLNFGTIDSYLVPKVGIVKESVTVPPQAPDVQILTQFVPGGK